MTRPGCTQQRPVLLVTLRPPPGCCCPHQDIAIASRTCGARNAALYGRTLMHVLPGHWGTG